MKLVPRKNQGQSTGQWGSLMPLRDAMNHMLDDSLWNPFGSMSKDPFFNTFFFDSRPGNMPSVDFSETENEYSIEADIPGFSSDDLDIELNGNLLTIRGKRKEEKEEKNKTYHLHERREAQFERSFTLPSSSELEKIDCNVKDGKLTITIPKSEHGKGRKLKVN